MGQARDKQELFISQRARERRSELQDYSTDALIDLILYLEGLLPSDTATFPRPLGLRPFEMAWQPHEYVRVGRPPVSEKVWHETAWRIALVSFDLAHPVLGLELAGEVLVGRADDGFSPDVDLAPYDGAEYGVSRQHALLRLRDNQLELVDLGSSNGTFVNGAPLHPGATRALKHKDRLEFGGLQFEVRIIRSPA